MTRCIVGRCAAVWARTVRAAMLVRKPRSACSAGRIGRIEQVENVRLDDVIEDVESIAPKVDEASLAQDHQLLRDAGLTYAQRRFHVADAVFALAKDLKDGKPSGMGKSFQHPGGGSGGIDSSVHIQYSEYRILFRMRHDHRSPSSAPQTNVITCPPPFEDVKGGGRSARGWAIPRMAVA